MPKKKLSAVRGAQKKVLESASAVGKSISDVLGKAGLQLGRLDKKINATATARELGGLARDTANEIDCKYHIADRTAQLKQDTVELADKARRSADRVAEKTGMYAVANKAGEFYNDHVSRPAAEVIEKYGLDKRLDTLGRACESLYGQTRGVIKPYFPPETPIELLQNTRKELAYISACIMQISPGEAEKIAGQFGKAVVSKIAAIATTGTLLSLVSTFGTAGTGTAIASLSGAASANATLAWVGGLLGGGMATGAALTGGITLVVGLGAYKLLGSQRRAFENLSEVEQRIVQYCWMLIAIIDDYLEQEMTGFGPERAKVLLKDSLLPLQAILEENSENICANLDKKNAAAFRQHVLRDFSPAIVEPFADFIEYGLAGKAVHYDYVIGGVIYALMTRSVIDDGPESQLVLDALRRSDHGLAHATETELSNYLDAYSPEQLKGIANNVKGIYHEMMWVEQFNASHDDARAELYEATNHIGSDVKIIDTATGDVVAEYQLKATDSVAYVNEHLVRYPQISVLATEEVAAKMNDVHSSQFRDTDLEKSVGENLDALRDNTIGDRLEESAESALAISTGHALVEMLRGNREFPEAVVKVVKKTGTAAAATAVTAYLFS